VPTGQATAADIRLIRRLAKKGLHVTVRQLQEWRRLGILEPPDVVRRGRRGTEALDYPPGAVDRVEQILRMLSKHRDMSLVVIGLFGVGVTPTERALRNAYRQYFDRSEADDTKNLVLADAPTTTFSRKVYKLASDMNEQAPWIVDRWNADARARAASERQYLDADDQGAHVTSKDIRERDAETFLLARRGEPGGDARPLLRAFGLPENRVEAMHDDGGIPSYAECRSALDATEFDKIVMVRDVIRDSWDEYLAVMLPEQLAMFINPLVDQPETFGLLIGGSAVLSALVFAYRELEAEGGSAEEA
jgi:hypothetical protein